MRISAAGKVGTSNFRSCAFCSVVHTMFFMALIIAQTQSARCAEPGGASEKLMATIERPTTTIQVLQNFKFALDNDLFLRDDFYTDENLGKFFAANKVFWYEMTPARTSGFVYTQYSVGFFPDPWSDG